MNKGQSAIEFMIIVGALLFFFSFLLFILYGTLVQQTHEGVNAEVQAIAEQVQREVVLAVSAEDGYQRQFFLPTRIGTLNYTATLVNTSVYVHTDDGKFALSLPIYPVSGFLQKGTNTIRNVNGSIFFNS